jgi:transposase
MRKHWLKLTLFLRVPGAVLDNNVCERALKKAILHRKNALFYKTQNGAHVGDIFMSLIYTAELNDESPFDYLVALQRHHEAAAATPVAWMPWCYREALARLGKGTAQPGAPDTATP